VCVRRVIGCSVILALMASVSACTGSHRAARSGAIVGSLEVVGGPPPSPFQKGPVPLYHPIARADVRILRPPGSTVVATAVSDARGRFRAAVPAGSYVVIASWPGFAGSLKTSVHVEPGTTSAVRLTLPTA
jgi:hypothetical protein